MNTYNLFNCQFVPVQLHLSAPECCLSGKRALVTVLDEVSHNINWTFLTDPKTNISYLHEFVRRTPKDVFIIRVANKRVYEKPVDFVEEETPILFPYLYVIVDCRQDIPVVMIEDYSEVPSSTDEVVKVLTYSFNRVLKKQGWSVKMRRTEKEPIAVPNRLQKTMEPLMKKPRTFEGLYDAKNIFEVYQKMEKKRKTPDIRNKIMCTGCAEEILALLHDLIDGKTTPKSIMRPVHAAIVAGVMDRISLSMFRKEFGNIMDNSSTLFYDYQAIDAPVYYNDSMTKTIINMFMEIVSSYNKKIG